MSPPTSLPSPQALSNLIESGFWPTTEVDEVSQNLNPLVPRDKIKAFAPEEDDIYFYRPPFCSVSWRKKHGEEFWDWQMAAAHEIDADMTLLIGDFGLGSDAPIALDYRRNLNNPSVIRLKWSQEGNHWVEVAPTFEDLVKLLLA